jgi:hypothetical protein
MAYYSVSRQKRRRARIVKHERGSSNGSDLAKGAFGVAALAAAFAAGGAVASGATWVAVTAGAVVVVAVAGFVFVDSSGGEGSAGSGGDEGSAGGEGGDGGEGGGACFVGGTPITLPDGTIKPIEMMKAGEYVLSRNEVTASTTAQRVSRTWKHKVQATLLLELTNGEKLETTKEHALFVVDKGFTRAGQLAPGATLTCESGESLQVGTITQNHRENTVYNIEVENFHTYFVGKNRLWAHNKEKANPDED